MDQCHLDIEIEPKLLNQSKYSILVTTVMREKLGVGRGRGVLILPGRSQEKTRLSQAKHRYIGRNVKAESPKQCTSAFKPMPSISGTRLEILALAYKLSCHTSSNQFKHVCLFFATRMDSPSREVWELYTSGVLYTPNAMSYRNTLQHHVNLVLPSLRKSGTFWPP